MALFEIHSLDTGADPDEAAPSSAPSPRPLRVAEPEPMSQAAALPVSTLPSEPDVSLIVAHLNALLEERQRQLDMAARRVETVQGLLLRLADELCPAGLDTERRKTGASLEEWPPEQLAALISNHTRERLQKADQAARQHDMVMKAYQQLLAEHPRHETDRSSHERPEATGALLPAAAPTPVAVETPPADPPSARRDDSSGDVISVDPQRVDDVVRVMAATGLARGPRLREKLSAMWGIDRRDSRIGRTLEAAAALGYARLHPVRVEWRGAPAQFLELTEAGLERAGQLGARVVSSEMAEGVRRHLSLALISLVLRAAEVLSDHGYTEVIAFPRPIQLPDGVEYAPMLSARDRSANTLYIECERERVLLPRDERWRLAARVGGGAVHLVTTSPALQAALTTEINLIRVTHIFRLMAFNMEDYQKGRRGPDNSIWAYNR